MFYFEKNNVNIGRYLKALIENRYKSVRQFCIAYLKLANLDTTDDAIAKMQNRMSQIINGNKAIQTYDLPLFCELLDASCEEILSAGKHYVPISGHVTNYEIAFSNDKEKWERYIHRKDQPFLHADEYGKTVIDYALACKNYALMKYLMDKKYIWFVDNSKENPADRLSGFGAGTSIKGNNSFCGTAVRLSQCEENGLRQKMIALALEHDDLDTLENLRAREVPTLYQRCSSSAILTHFKDYYSEEILSKIEKASDKVLGYFSDEFAITDAFKNKQVVVYPYLSTLLEQMIQSKNRYTEVLLRRAIAHNKRALDKLQAMVDEAFDLASKQLNFDDSFKMPDDSFKMPVDSVIKCALDSFRFEDDGDFLTYYFCRGKGDNPKFCTNIMRVSVQSSDLLIGSLIEELNTSYNAVRHIQPETSNYGRRCIHEQAFF